MLQWSSLAHPLEDKLSSNSRATPSRAKVKPHRHYQVTIPVIPSSIPASLRPSGSPFNSNYWRRSRFSWCIVAILLILIYVTYRMYAEHMRQLRVQAYETRVADIKTSIKSLELNIFKAKHQYSLFLDSKRLLRNK